MPCSLTNDNVFNFGFWIFRQFIEEKWGYIWSNEDQRKFWAQQLSAIIVLSSMILSPISGKVLDIVGNRPYFSN